MKSQKGGAAVKPQAKGMHQLGKAGGDSACGISEMKGAISKPMHKGHGMGTKSKIPGR